MKMRWLPAFLWLIILPLAAAGKTTLPTIPLTIQTRTETLSFKVEVAKTDKQQEHGLMFRTSVGDYKGMLFPLASVQPVAFWMRNTLVPLDMVFIDEKGVIARIAANATPRSLDAVPSLTPVKAVLEIAGGSAARHHIAAGDKVYYTVSP